MNYELADLIASTIIAAVPILTLLGGLIYLYRTEA